MVGTTTAVQTVRSARLTNAAFLICAGGLLAFALYPGRFDNDSISMYQQGQALQFHDWHSPLMSVLMASLSPLQAGPGPLFALQIVLWIAGLVILTDSLIVFGRPYAAQTISILSMLPLVTFNFVEVQKDVLLVALTSVFIGFGARSLLLSRLRWGPIFALVMFGLFVVALDARKNAFTILLVLCFLYFPARELRLGPVLKSTATAVALFFAALTAGSWLDHSLLGATRLHPVAILLTYDLAGISANAHYDASEGTLDLTATGPACYKAWGADPYILECSSTGDRAMALVDGEPTKRILALKWFKAVAKHPIAYLEHRISHFDCLIRLGCDELPRWPMGQGLITRTTWPEATRVTTVGRVLEIAAVKSYSSVLGDGWFWLLVLVAEAGIMARLLYRNGFDPIRYMVLVLTTGALAYEVAFFFLGVSSALRYFHIVFFVGTLSLPLFVSALTQRRLQP
jgi:hypothetical protein